MVINSRTFNSDPILASNNTFIFKSPVVPKLSFIASYFFFFFSPVFNLRSQAAFRFVFVFFVFLMWTIFKVFIEFVTILLLFYVLTF